MFYKNFIVLITISVSISFNCMSSEVSTYIANSTQISMVKVLTDEQFKAIKSGDLKAVQEMIESQGFSTESTDKMGNTMLIISLIYFDDMDAQIVRNKVEVAKYLIEKGANIEAKDRHTKKTPLLLISSYFEDSKRTCTSDILIQIFYGDIIYDFISYLISKGVDLEVKDYDKRSVLYYAITAGDKKLVELIVSVSSYKYCLEGSSLVQELADYYKDRAASSLDVYLREKYKIIKQIKQIFDIYQDYHRNNNLVNAINPYLISELSRIVKSYVLR